MPTSSPDYIDLEVRIEPLRDNRYPIKLVVGGERQFPGFLDSAILTWVPSASPEDDGQQLFDRLFASPDLRSAWGEARGKSALRCIRLAIDSAAPELHAVPWELLREHVSPYPPTTLAAAGDTPFSRYLTGGWEPGQPVQGRPVRMLVAIANPDNLPTDYQLQAIDVDQEWQSIQAAANHAGIHLERLSQPCTLAALVDKVAEGFHILHLVCHGAHSERDGVAKLYLADKKNQVQLVSDEEFAEALRNRLPAVTEEKRLRLVFLASCETATRSPVDAFRGLAPKLVDAGVPVVLAMQDKVAVDTARAFAGAFYVKLLEHGRVDLACNQARAHVQADRLPGSSIPVLFMRLKDGRLLKVRSDKELAYLQDIILRRREYDEKYTPMPAVVERPKATAREAPDRVPSSPMEPEFVMLRKRGTGPQAEIERIAVHDLRQAVEENRRLVVLGEPGAGKTTSLWNLAYHQAQAAQEDAQASLPIFVLLGAYTGPEPALEYVKAQVGGLAPELASLLRDGRAMLLLDALNEMPQVGYQERVGRVQALLSEFPRAPVVVTCRELDYVEKLDLPKLEIQPLGPMRQRDFLERYLGKEADEALFWQVAGDETLQAWQAWQTAEGTWQEFWSGQTMPEEFRWRAQRSSWERLRGGELPPLLALGRNPYMLRMMQEVYEGERGGALATNRGQLFAAFAATLLERERRRQLSDPERWPGSDLIQRSLAQLAYAMQSASERGTAVDQAWAKKQLAVDGRDPAWLLHLARRASLLELEAGKVRFVHQLIQEYFAALALKERLTAGEDLRRYWPEGWVDPTGWEETCVLLAGILPDMTPLLKQLLVANPPLAARCIAESGGERPVEAIVQAVQQRLVELMTDRQVPIPQRNAAGVAVNCLGDPRPGVGLRPDGLPDIDWVLVPDRNPKTGRREYIYQQDERRIEPDFWIARYPITYRQFQAFLDAPDGYHSERWWQGLTASQEHRLYRSEQQFKHWNHPRESVSWYEAMAFCAWLAARGHEQPGALPGGLDLSRDWKITLPTEWQWEKTARGHDGRQYPWGDTYHWGRANIDETRTKRDSHYLRKTSAVGVYPHAEPGDSPYGVADLSGNVWEWCLNEFRNPANTQVGGGATRVVRGGSWSGGYGGAATPFRNSFQVNRSSNIGFRVVVVGCVPNA